MEKFFEALINFLLPMNNIYLYIFLFISAIVENLFPPIPGDTITALGAFLVGIGRLNYFWVYLSTTIGSVVGYMSLFLFSKYLGRKFFYERNFKFFPVEKIEKTELWIKKHSYWIILINRFLPGIRSVISIVSGISHVNTFVALLFSFISASIWNLIWIHVGFVLGCNWEIVKEKFSIIIKQYNIIAGIILTAIIIIFICIKLKKKKNVLHTTMKD